MSSPCRCAAAIIARSIAVAMKPHGGKILALIRPSLPALYGWAKRSAREVSRCVATGHPAKWPGEAGRSFRYAPLSSGLDIQPFQDGISSIRS
jgi:hypothetical protein